MLVIDNYDSFTYNLVQILSEIDPAIRVVRNDCITLDEIREINPTGIVISPGPGRPEDAGICVELIKTFAPEIPILGVCLGHQAIGLAFGARVIHAPEIVHGKSARVFHHRGELYRGIPLPFNAGRYHSLCVDQNDLPAALSIEAITADGLIMGMKHQDYPCFGVQFHPESILSPDGSKILKNFREICTRNIIC